MQFTLKIHFQAVLIKSKWDLQDRGLSLLRLRLTLVREMSLEDPVYILISLLDPICMNKV